MKLDERTQERLVSLIEKGEAVLATYIRLPLDRLSNRPNVDGQQFAEWRGQSLVCLTQLFGPVHDYTASFTGLTEQHAYGHSVRAGLGILRAALEDVEQGHLASLQDMATAEVFSDFLDQADHLLEHGYSAPAASLAGAVLENGLRSLAERNEIAVKPRDDLSALNSKLAGKTIYNRLRQKQVAVWIDVRNAADHGRFDEFTADDVADVVKGVRNLLAEML
ncbi:MAG: hypothetical protein OXI51_08545 [Chloroflexota bacterium]|nr:hypothetical protein [Chloroflexota bacterium]